MHSSAYRLHTEAEEGDPPETTFIEAAQRNGRRDELEQAIAANIDNDPHEHRWVDITFELRGVSDLHYQILQVHHNLMGLDAEMGSIVDDITREWELQLQDAAMGSSGFEYRTLTLHSEDADEQRSLAETILRRVYGVDIADVGGIELSP